MLTPAERVPPETAAGSDPRDAYVSAVAARDADAAAAVVAELLDDGMEPIRVLTDVVAVTQREVGYRWQRAEWSIAEEHAATAISVSATKTVRAHVERIPVTRGRVVIACAEREWHELPAMIIDCALRAAGWDTTLLGASTSPLRLNQYVQDLGPEAVAVSCSVLGALPALRRFIEASTASGVPVLAGGPALGRDDRRARALGATAWAPDAVAAVAAMDTLPAVVPAVPPLAKVVADEHAALDMSHPQLVDRIRTQWPLFCTTEPDHGRVSHDFASDAVRQMLHAVSAALLTGDPTPIPEMAAWIADLLRTRGFSPALIDELGALLTAELREYPLARALVENHLA